MTRTTIRKGYHPDPPSRSRKGYHPGTPNEGRKGYHPDPLDPVDNHPTGPEKGVPGPPRKGVPPGYPHPEQTFTRSKSWSVEPVVRQPSRTRARDPRCHFIAAPAVSLRRTR